MSGDRMPESGRHDGRQFHRENGFAAVSPLSAGAQILLQFTHCPLSGTQTSSQLREIYRKEACAVLDWTFSNAVVGLDFLAEFEKGIIRELGRGGATLSQV